MSFDLAVSLRRRKPQRGGATLARRADEALPFVSPVAAPGPELLLDTTVYIDVAQGCTPLEVDRLLLARKLNHSVIALAELTHLFGRFDPQDPRTPGTLARLRTVINMMPAHRLTSPSPRAFAEGGMLAGLAARLTGAPHTAALLNDAVLLLHAAETGRTLLTRNVRDFDSLTQLAPEGRVMLYRQV